MKLLLDTHAIIWALTGDPRLPESAVKAILSPENIVFFSAASLWEIAVKNQKKPDICPYREDEIFRLCIASGYEPLDIRPGHVIAVRDLRTREGRTPGNYDSFDRLLIAQAKTENCILLSHDSNFANYDEKCIRLI